MESIFENTFVIGLIIGLVLFPLVDWLGDKARPKIKKEPEKDNPRYQLWEHMHNEHNLKLLDSEIDEIIYHVNNINNEKANITTAPEQQTDI